MKNENSLFLSDVNHKKLVFSSQCKRIISLLKRSGYLEVVFIIKQVARQLDIAGCLLYHLMMWMDVYKAIRVGGFFPVPGLC